MLTSRVGKRREPQQITDALQYLCRSLLRRGVTSSTIRAHAAAVRAIADPIHPHSARHLYAIAVEANGIPLRQISACARVTRERLPALHTAPARRSRSGVAHVLAACLARRKPPEPPDEVSG
ncbi:hypothetical protein QRX50_36525 [Amycolatopsis carbonis]|uniref:Core-binding (CB) domain-containing protein n=1 Tax=Amycolatopsis carbonis TaxID=715471 RepID=A0A9Y2ICS6_9PSEU|nr:hypothetical protein [Amycolatopsis sp. 2-15]WIX76891.1 hypothetical protein QRX50_36525 [Amycolatopsis sp. 2-15]